MQNLEDKELKTLIQCFGSLNELDDLARRRVLNWLNSRFYVDNESNSPESPAPPQPITQEVPSIEKIKLALPYKSLSNLLNYFQPRTAAEKVLYTSCFLHEQMGMYSLTGRMINDELKKINEGVRNITATINALIEKNPPMMIQMEKNGLTPQAQKKYKVTEEGREEVMKKVQLLER